MFSLTKIGQMGHFKRFLFFLYRLLEGKRKPRFADNANVPIDHHSEAWLSMNLAEWGGGYFLFCALVVLLGL